MPAGIGGDICRADIRLGKSWHERVCEGELILSNSSSS